jgi:hypothetical protein
MKIKNRIFASGLVVALSLLAVVGLMAANEITVSTGLTVDNGSFKQVKTVSNLRLDQSNSSMSAGIQSIQTGVWEQLIIAADVATNGWAFMRALHTDAGEFIWIGTGALWTNDAGTIFTNYHAFMQLEASEPVQGRLNGTNPVYAMSVSTQASTGLDLEFFINED